MNKKQKPSIRFKGFTEDWEERKLGDVAEIVGGGTPSTSVSKYWDGTINWYSPAEISELIYLSSSQRKITEEGYKHCSAKILPVGTVLFTSRAGIGKTAILSRQSCTNQGFQSIVPHKDKLDSYFIFSRSGELKRYGETVGAGSTFVEVSGKQMADMDLMLPKTIVEQQVIGSYFKQLDYLITLHQRKYDKLVNVKKSMLEKMFPRNGKNVPEIRFAGFTEDWKQRKLGEVACYRRGSFPQPYGKSDWYDGDGAMPFVQVADVTDEMNLVDNTKQKISKQAQPMSVYAEKNSVLVTLQGSIGRVAITQYGTFVDRTVLIFEKYKTTIDNLFWAYIIKQKFIEEARKAPGGTIKTITKEALSEFDLLLPNYDEQHAIGSYFKHLDHLITLHKRKVEKLQNIKKSCLEKMFV
ncbi:MAG: restriction endonuclease subunit S [Lachnospiraceae bacterium]|nr:restriction endonuclease subunit S [Lachnospiraceae bacterium]